MNQFALKYSLISATLVASVAAPWLVQLRTLAQCRERQTKLEQRSAQITELAAENQRLQNRLTEARADSLSSDQFRELLKLRGEIRLLREDAGELVRLKAAHSSPLAATRNPEAAPRNTNSVLAYWPKEQLAPAGYAEPVSGLQSALCAMARNIPDALADAITPAAKTVLLNNGFSGNHPAERIAAGAKSAADALGPATGFYVVSQTLESQHRAILDVYFETEGATRSFELNQIGEEWKVNGIYSASMWNDRPGVRLWPQ
jgi:hypothetical protein